MKATLRITGGEKVRQRISSLDLSVVRPTPHIIRQALGNILRNEIEGARCLDLFAGTGAVGIEFLSWGADFCVFVDNLGAACQAIEGNLEKLRLKERGWVMHADAITAIRRLGERDEKIDIIFADPPYKYELTPQIIRAIEESSILRQDGVIIIERAKSEYLDSECGTFQLDDKRRYGQTALYFYRRKAGNDRTAGQL